MGKCEDTQVVVAHSHLGWVKVYVLQGLVALWLQREVALDDACLLYRADKFLIRKSAEPDKARVVHDMLELLHRFHITDGHVPVHFFGDDVPSTESRKVALHTVALLGGLRQV